MLGILILTITGLIMSIILVLLDNKDTRSDEFLKHLPGYNCGACGFGSCQGMSEKMVEDIDNYKKCKPLRGEALEKMEEFVKNYKR